MKIKLSLLLTLLFVIFFVSINYAQESYVINAKTVNVRTEASIKSKITGTIEQGEVVSVKNKDNSEWWLISYYGIEGYVSSKFLISLEQSKKYSAWKKVDAITGDNFNCENIQPKYDTAIDNELIINVGNNSDAVVKLMNYAGICSRISYIRAGDRYTMKNIPLGDYYLKIAYGKEFRKFTQDNQCIVKFLRDPVYKKGSQNLAFRKIKKANKIIGDKEYSDWDISYFELALNVQFTSGTGKGDTLGSEKISENDFNQ